MLSSQGGIYPAHNGWTAAVFWLWAGAQERGFGVGTLGANTGGLGIKCQQRESQSPWQLWSPHPIVRVSFSDGSHLTQHGQEWGRNKGRISTQKDVRWPHYYKGISHEALHTARMLHCLDGYEWGSKEHRDHEMLSQGPFSGWFWVV